MRSVSVICAVRNRFLHFARMVQAFEDAHDRELVELVAVDFASDDGDVQAQLKGSLLRTVYVRLDPPFRRAGGLNVGFGHSTSEVVFFCDADIIVPSSIVDTILGVVKPGVAYFPICRDLGTAVDPRAALAPQLKQPGALGRWRTAGYGMCAFTREDFGRIGKWDESFVRWGGEDNELYTRSRRKGIRAVRKKLHGLFHLHHPRARAFLNRHYVEQAGS